MHRTRTLIMCAIAGLALAVTATPVAAQANQGQQERAAEQPIVILFAPGSAELDRPAQEGLEDTALIIAEDPQQQMLVVLVIDEADPMAQQRATAARSQLERSGVSPERIRTARRSEAEPMAGMPGLVIVELAEPGAETMRPRQQQQRQPQQQMQRGDQGMQEDESLGEEWQEAGEATGGALEETGDAIVDTGQAAGEAITDVGQAAVETVRSPTGVSVSLGAGVYDFFDGDTRDFTDTGGMWEARVTYVTPSPLGIEAAYIGSYQDVSALGLDEDANLIGTTFEAAGRYNVLSGMAIQPYVVAGIGLTHYDLDNVSFNTSNVANNDTLLHIPLAAGVSYNVTQSIFLDGRFTARPVLGDDMIATEGGGTTDLHSWALAARGGFRF